MPQSTIDLFRHLYDHLPPLFPDATKQKMREALERVEKAEDIPFEEVEDLMIKFGYEVWPYNQSYREFMTVAEEKVGEHFLLPKLSAPLQSKYKDFKLYGGTLRDLRSGRPAGFFTSGERVELCQALVEIQNELRQYVSVQLNGSEKDQYLRRINDFLDVLIDIKNSLDDLRLLADREADHPMLAREIRAQVRAFEHGLCSLGPELNYAAVCHAPEFFIEHKKHLNRLSGIHEPVEVDFYNQKN